MWIAVASDAHEDTYALEKLAKVLPKIDVFCYLGDCVGDGEWLRQHLSECQPSAAFHMVSGNNDWHVLNPQGLSVRLPMGQLFMAHGHTYRVKQTYDLFAAHAANVEAALALFGHTHCPYVGWHGATLLVNPGTLSGLLARGRGTYALIEWTKDGIMPEIRTI